ncbi:hypothetical protein EVA_07691 [gut metagenome]|uniref:Uncharacterized protein n=1 Tax=gut metagenome TaxID=749906 RepID=J9GUQ3_9ZZZZ
MLFSLLLFLPLLVNQTKPLPQAEESFLFDFLFSYH